MTAGVIENVSDAKWLIAAGAPEHSNADVMVSALSGVALWYAYELTRNSRATDDMMIDENGYFLIALNDDVNFGWCHYRKRAESDEAAREAVRKRFGDVVSIPLKAFLSQQHVGIW